MASSSSSTSSTPCILLNWVKPVEDDVSSNKGSAFLVLLVWWCWLMIRLWREDLPRVMVVVAVLGSLFVVVQV